MYDSSDQNGFPPEPSEDDMTETIEEMTKKHLRMLSELFRCHHKLAQELAGAVTFNASIHDTRVDSEFILKVVSDSTKQANDIINQL
jgi:hypothetical protein